MKCFFIAISALVIFGCSSAQTDEEITKKIIQLIENQPNRWVSIETLRNSTFSFNSDDGKDEITLSIRKTIPSTAVMFSPYRVEFSPHSSAKLEFEFNNWYCRPLKRTEKSNQEIGEGSGEPGKGPQVGGLNNTLHS
jgi:hypothetical protein